MCGINGIVRLRPDAPPIDRQELERTCDRMASRGPDGEGMWTSPKGDAAFGHRRLAIIDLSPAGAQPMRSPDGRYTIVFNGEIYNYRELRDELIRDGHSFRSHSDTEVLLALHARYGVKMFPKLRGMYAFGLWDDRDHRLLLARDPYGIKPLYYAEGSGIFRFASQVQALKAGRGVPLDVDPAGLVGFLLWGSVPEPFTLRRAIRALPAGHYLEVADGRVSAPRPHYDFGAPFDEAPQEDALHALGRSIQAHLVADVPVAVFLSSGLDSALVTALAQRHAHEPLRTFTLAFDEFRGTPLDEAPGAATVARLLGTNHTEKRVGPADFQGLWQQALAAMDQPSIDGVNVFLLSHFASEARLKVVLSGMGGDEVFGSYPSFVDVPRWARWARAGTRVPGLPRAWRGLVHDFRPARPKIAGLLKYGTTLPGAYFLRRGLHLPEELPLLIGDDLAREGLAAYDPVADSGKHVGNDPAEEPWLAVHRMESTQYLRNQLLRDADWASMAHSLELRAPFVDVRLRQALAAARFEPARSQGKPALVRMLAPELPEAVLRRAKSGFMVPVRTLVRGERTRGRQWGLEARWLAREVLRDGFGVALETPPAGPRAARAARSTTAASGGTLFLLTEAFHRPGGIQTYNRDQIQAIRRCAPDEPLTLLVLNDSASEVRQSEWDGLTVFAYSRRRLAFTRKSLAFARSQRPRRIILGHRNFLALAPALRAAASGSSLWLLTYGMDAHRTLGLVEQACLRVIDRVFAISPQTAAAFTRAGFHREIELWPCSLPFSWDQPALAPPTMQAPYRLLTVSRLAAPERYKGIDDTIAAVGRLLESRVAVTLDIVGDGEDLPRLRQLARRCRAEQAVTFHGRLETESVKRLYEGCDIFVLPSGAEGFGIVYLEALAYGKPVIAADAGGSPFVVKPGVSGFLIKYGDVDALVVRIQECIAKPAETRAVGLRGREWARDHFSFAALVERTRTLLGGNVAAISTVRADLASPS